MTVPATSEPRPIAITLWAFWTALFCGAIALTAFLGALASGAGILAGLGFLVFFGTPSFCAALRAMPVAWRGRFARLRVRPATFVAALMVFCAAFLWAVAFGAVYALFSVDLPGPDGLFYLLFPFVIIALAGAGYFTWTYEKLTFPPSEPEGGA
jgi:hypothetical protein